MIEELYQALFVIFIYLFLELELLIFFAIRSIEIKINFTMI